MKQSSDFFLFFELSHVSHPDFLEFTASILNPGQVSRGSDDSGTFILKGLNKKVLKFWDSMLEISIILKKIQNFRNQKFEENCAANSIKVNQIRWKQTPSFFISCSKIHVISCQNKNVKHPLMEEVFSLLVALRLAEVRIRQKSVSERRSRGARSSPQPSEIFFSSARDAREQGTLLPLRNVAILKNQNNFYYNIAKEVRYQLFIYLNILYFYRKNK